MNVDEEVVHPVPKLLDVGVLVGRPFVAVDADALVDPLAVQVQLACRATP